MASRHTELVRACINYVVLRGGLAWKMQTGRFKIGTRWVHAGAAGAPDILGVIPGGRLVAIEVKTGTGRVQRHQALVHTELRRLGAIVVIARSVLDVEQALPS